LIWLARVGLLDAMQEEWIPLAGKKPWKKGGTNCSLDAR